tara:strand:+ start:1540 stop:1947 length:408 start_codon:yes stop_codon:yes gene_type:complete
MAMLLESIPKGSPQVLFFALLSNPRRPQCDKGTPVLRYFARKQNFMDGFSNASWKRFRMTREGPDATNVYHVLPYPDHKIRDIGTFMASATADQPCPKIGMVVPKFSLKKHFIQLYKAGIKYAKPDYDILDFIKI